ncbi:ankyrin repeat domain-containing protein [Williamsia sterculiae]|uniref:Uncharacterized protein n=1 Tax=Williamsia sterculiae TaxID=1344003 RepID=A0A1N7GGP4_9NOCA|nr:ankyrin repeat domain-containing protein [Williamsia sterculiae]SIS11720.1 hypothetical protein SAMN05445060_2761 [Williamsia sterculiae]
MADRMGRIPLHYYALEGEADKVREALADGADVNARDDVGFTPLSFAAQEAKGEVVKILLDAGAEVDVRDTRNGNTPLWNSVFSSSKGGDGKWIAMRELLDRGADPDLKNNHDRSPREVVDTMVNEQMKEIFAEHPPRG